MNRPDEGMNLAIFNAEGILLSDHPVETLQTPYHLVDKSLRQLSLKVQN
jgi:hypothetical protein